VPDAAGQLTSNHGWDTIKEQSFLKSTIATFKAAGIRVSIFVDADIDMVKSAADTGTDRIELYTESYAKAYALGKKEEGISSFLNAAEIAQKYNLGLNAGHDLDLQNLKFFANNLPNLLEVSIGHALISDALYLGLENTVQMYKRQLGAANMP
jgi:pyridoxine 5-phosphate synthase